MQQRVGLTPSPNRHQQRAIPAVFFEPRDPRLNRQALLTELKQGATIAGVALANPEPVLSVRTK